MGNLDGWDQFLTFLAGTEDVLLLILRILVPLLSLLVIVQCFRSVRRSRRKAAPVVMLENIVDQTKIPVLYWENSIGRSKSCDITVPDGTMSRDHAVLMRREAGWEVIDTGSKSGTRVNGVKIKGSHMVLPGDRLTFGSTTLMLIRAEGADSRTSTDPFRRIPSPAGLFTLVLLIQLFLAIQVCCGADPWRPEAFLLFGMLALVEIAFYLFCTHVFDHISFEVETVGLLLSGIGIFLQTSMSLDVVITQLVALVGGICLFTVMIWFMGNLDRVNRWRKYIAAAGVLLLCATLVVGTSINGAKNWIYIGSFSIQPGEFVKIAFIFGGAATLDRLQTRRNLTEFILFGIACGACFVLMHDMGSAAIFFITFLLIAFMRSGSLRTVFLATALVALGLFMFLQLKPYAADRFSIWGHVWDDVNGLGYQQSRTLTYIASGGLFGVGLGRGYLVDMPEGNSDLVFGMLCEEQGLLLSFVVLLAIVLFIFYARSDVIRSRSTFYSITACAAAGLLLFQTALNVMGPTDILPLTGVTLPWISAGGSSMMAVWGLLAFIKASDERTYAARRKSA